jgi:hypothetical protein
MLMGYLIWAAVGHKQPVVLLVQELILQVKLDHSIKVAHIRMPTAMVVVAVEDSMVVEVEPMVIIQAWAAVVAVVVMYIHN